MLYEPNINIQLLKKGDERAFENLYKQYFNALYFFAIQYIDKKPEAENLVQETFMALWLNKENLSGNTPASIKSWLYTSLKNKCLNYLDKERNQHQFNNYSRSMQLANINILGQMQISEVTFDEIENLLMEALSHMPEQCRKVFELSRFYGLKNKAIAEELDISVKAVEANITRALKLLRLHLKDYLPLCFFIGLF